MFYPRCKALLAAMATLVVLAAPCSAQTLRVSLEELAEKSDAIVFGRTIATDSYWAPDSSAILTRVVIRAENPESGQAIGEQVVTVPGGRIGNYLHEVSDMPAFRVDEEVVVFLERHPSGLTIVAGGAQGKLQVLRDEDTGIQAVRGAEHLLSEDPTLIRSSVSRRETLVDGEVKRATLPMGEFLVRLKKLGLEP